MGQCVPFSTMSRLRRYSIVYIIPRAQPSAFVCILRAGTRFDRCARAAMLDERSNFHTRKAHREFVSRRKLPREQIHTRVHRSRVHAANIYGDSAAAAATADILLGYQRLLIDSASTSTGPPPLTAGFRNRLAFFIQITGRAGVFWTCCADRETVIPPSHLHSFSLAPMNG